VIRYNTIVSVIQKLFHALDKARAEAWRKEEAKKTLFGNL